MRMNGSTLKGIAYVFRLRIALKEMQLMQSPTQLTIKSFDLIKLNVK